MSPEERALIDGLFQRMRDVSNQARDVEADALIARYVSQMPYAPYALAQTVLVQEHALRQAQARIESLEAQARSSAPAATPTSFLGGLLGGRGASVPTIGARSAPDMSASPPPPQPDLAPAAAPRTPWGQSRGIGGFGGSGAGGFLQGAMTTAAGVAGGMLLADGIRSLMSSGSGPIAEQAATLMDPFKSETSSHAARDDSGQMAQDARVDDPADTSQSLAPQDADDDSTDDWSDDSSGGDWT